MSKNNRNNNEGKCRYEVAPANFALVVQPPEPLGSMRRGDNSGLRSASPFRMQFVIVVPDDSASMALNGKADAMTEAVQETIYQTKIKSPRKSAFLLSIHRFGDHFMMEQELTLQPCLKINEDKLRFRGDSGGTKMRNAAGQIERLVTTYEEQYLRLHEDPERVPPPLVIILSDGYSGDGDPTEICQRLCNTPLSIGVPPLIITVGIEFGGGEPNVSMLQAMSSKTSEGRPLYFDISEARMLTEFLSVISSSSAASADEVARQADEIQDGWNVDGEGN